MGLSDGSGSALFGLYCFQDTEDVVKHVSVFCGCRFCKAFMFETFSLITDEVDVLVFRCYCLVVDE